MGLLKTYLPQILRDACRHFIDIYFIFLRVMRGLGGSEGFRGWGGLLLITYSMLYLIEEVIYGCRSLKTLKIIHIIPRMYM